jgi:hypothetical protein
MGGVIRVCLTGIVLRTAERKGAMVTSTPGSFLSTAGGSAIAPCQHDHHTSKQGLQKPDHHRPAVRLPYTSESGAMSFMRMSHSSNALGPPNRRRISWNGPGPIFASNDPATSDQRHENES